MPLLEPTDSPKIICGCGRLFDEDDGAPLTNDPGEPIVCQYCLEQYNEQHGNGQ